MWFKDKEFFKICPFCRTVPANGQELPGLQDTRATQGSIKRSSAILSRPAQPAPPRSPRQHRSCPQHRSHHRTMVRMGRFPQKTFSTAPSSPRPGQVLRQPTGARGRPGYGRPRPTSSQRRPDREGAQPHLTSSSSSSSQQRHLRGPWAGPAGTVLPSCPRTAAGYSRNCARATACGGFVCKERKMEKRWLTHTARVRAPRAVSGTRAERRPGRQSSTDPSGWREPALLLGAQLPAQPLTRLLQRSVLPDHNRASCSPRDKQTSNRTSEDPTRTFIPFPSHRLPQ